MNLNDKENKIQYHKTVINVSKLGAVFNSVMATIAFMYGLSTVGWILFASMLLFLLGWWSNATAVKILEKMK